MENNTYYGGYLLSINIYAHKNVSFSLNELTELICSLHWLENLDTNQHKTLIYV